VKMIRQEFIKKERFISSNDLSNNRISVEFNKAIVD